MCAAIEIVGPGLDAREDRRYTHDMYDVSQSYCACCDFAGYFEGDLCHGCREMYDELVEEARAAEKRLSGTSLARPEGPRYVKIGDRRFAY